MKKRGIIITVAVLALVAWTYGVLSIAHRRADAALGYDAIVVEQQLDSIKTEMAALKAEIQREQGMSTLTFGAHEDTVARKEIDRLKTQFTEDVFARNEIEGLRKQLAAMELTLSAERAYRR